MTRDGWVYTTDASWAAKGNRSGTRYHVPHPDDHGRPACSYHVLDDEHGGQPADEVPEFMRCKRRACASRWPEPPDSQETP